LSAHADYQCSVTPRDDVILSPQQVQVKGENGNLVIKPDGNLTFNGKQYALTPPSASRRRIIRPLQQPAVD
jgi:virulence-associated protein VagC